MSDLAPFEILSEMPPPPDVIAARRRASEAATRPAGAPRVAGEVIAPAGPPEPNAPPAPQAATIGAVLDQWSAEGALVHAPTGLAQLDELTDGGPVYGTRWYLVGAPDAGKTALLVQLAGTYLARGVAVGLLGADEEPGDLVGRLAQRHGYSRGQCERREAEDLAAIRRELGELPLRLYGPEWTIERAGRDLARFADARGARAMLGVDSIQTATCDAEDPSRSLREAVTARTVALRAAAQQHRLIAIATSEMNRAAYRNVEAAETSNDLASAKESGAIEFSARVMLALRSVPDEPDLVEVRLAKNKHGPRNGKVYLRLERARQVLVETEPPDQADHEAARASAARAGHVAAAAAAALAIADQPGVSVRGLRAALRLRLGGCSRERCDAAIVLLGRSVVTRPGRRGATQHFLVGERIPPQVLGELSPADRARAACARPPEETPNA